MRFAYCPRRHAPCMHIFRGGSKRWITSVLPKMVKTQNIERREFLQARSVLVYTTTYESYMETAIIREPYRNFDDDVWVMSTGGSSIWSERKVFNAHYVSVSQVGPIISIVYIVQRVDLPAV